jgi:hypothetical protein
MSAAVYPYWASATDTVELNMSSARFAAADTMWLPLAVMFADPPPRPEPCPERLPKRLRRRAALHLAESWRGALFTRAALAAAGLGLAASPFLG